VLVLAHGEIVVRADAYHVGILSQIMSHGSRFSEEAP
jgi:hypothetical protein